MLVDHRSLSSSRVEGGRNRGKIPLPRTIYKSRSNKLIVGALSHSAVLIKQLIGQGRRELPQVAPGTTQQGQRDDVTCRSTRSNHSRMSKLSVRSVRKEAVQSTSQVFYDSDEPQTPSRTPLEEMSSGELERYLDGLLNQRIQQMTALKKDLSVDMQSTIDLNQKLEAVVQHLSQRNSEQDETRSNASVYRSIDRKIALVERILSEKFVESEILKSFYQLATCGRTEYGRFGVKNNLSKFSRNELAPLFTDKNSAHANCSSSFLTKQSTNQGCYRKPSRDSYNIFRQEKESYRFRRQALPNSSYKENYLNYSGVMTMKPTNGQWQNHTIATKYHSSVGSTYSKDFVKRVQQPCGFRDLDCFKDKIKTLKLKYDGRKTGHPEVSGQLSRTMAKLQRQYNCRPTLKAQCTRSYQSQFTTTNRRQLTDKSNQQLCAAAPLDKRLQLMHNLYRLSHHKLL